MWVERELSMEGVFTKKTKVIRILPYVLYCCLAEYKVILLAEKSNKHMLSELMLAI